MLLYPPGSPFMFTGIALPLLSHSYDPSRGSLHMEHAVIFILYTTLDTVLSDREADGETEMQEKGEERVEMVNQ